MEHFAFQLRAALKKVSRIVTPHFRQVLRFLGLPYCYFFLVDWEKCTASRLQVMWDFLYIFFVLRYFPDNYSNCHLYELPRSEWAYYYGSGYHPYQRRQLYKSVQPPEYQILFEDKEVCQQLCRGAGLHIAPSPGVIDCHHPPLPQIQNITAGFDQIDLIAKPVSGASGIGIFFIRKADGEVWIKRTGSDWEQNDFTVKERILVQEIVDQHEAINTIYAGSVNTLRILTLLTPESETAVLSVLMRFGVGTAFIDNWSAGGIAVGVDLSSGTLMDVGYDKQGNGYRQHPDSGREFGSFTVPLWDQVIRFAQDVQKAFPYHPMLGLDIAVSPEGPLLLEINAIPDLILQEQTAGPLLKDPQNFALFCEYDLLFNTPQKRLHRRA